MRIITTWVVVVVVHLLLILARNDMGLDKVATLDLIIGLLFIETIILGAIAIISYLID